MKILLIFISIIATNSLFASTIPSETMKKQEISDILIENDNLIEKELSTSRVARISREVNENSVIRIERGNRAVRENRIVRMGRNSKGIRLARVVRFINEVKENKHPSIKLSALIKKLPL